MVISVPHPASVKADIDVRLELYKVMSKEALRILFLGRDAVFERLSEIRRGQVRTLLSEEIPSLACSVYRAEYLGMAVDFPQFFIWSVLQDQAEKDALIRNFGADLRTQFELVAYSLHAVDLGLQHLARAIGQIPQMTVAPRLNPSLV